MAKRISPAKWIFYFMIEWIWIPFVNCFLLNSNTTLVHEWIFWSCVPEFCCINAIQFAGFCFVVVLLARSIMQWVQEQVFLLHLILRREFYKVLCFMPVILGFWWPYEYILVSICSLAPLKILSTQTFIVIASLSLVSTFLRPIIYNWVFPWTRT